MTTTTLEVEVKERPILFSGPMVRAILEGRKTQTRRVVAKLPKGIKHVCELPESDYQYRFTDFNGTTIDLRCPYGRPQLPFEPPRDRLWVRETWRTEELDADLVDGIRFRADDAFVVIADTQQASEDWVVANDGYYMKWRPSIFMPRWASRITLGITNVRVERLQEISAADAKAEGVEPFLNRDATAWRAGFQIGWDEINGKRKGCTWADNPWVWAISFRKL